MQVDGRDDAPGPRVDAAQTADAVGRPDRAGGHREVTRFDARDPSRDAHGRGVDLEDLRRLLTLLAAQPHGTVADTQTPG